MLILLSRGTVKRRVRETKMNLISSRSHCILKIYLAVKHEQNSSTESVINLVDLAGTESIKKTECTGDARIEMASINKSLLVFRRIVAAMAKNDQVIHSGSVIVQMLKDSLNKRSYLTLLGCISPYKENKGETRTTLEFVSDAKQITMTPRQNTRIYEFKQSKTPKKFESKQVIRTPNSTTKMRTPFKRPWSVSQQNKFKQQFSEPHAKKPTQNTAKQISTIASTSKKISFMNNKTRHNSLSLEKANKPKAATNLFPKEKPINETTFMRPSIEFNWANASTSSVIERDQNPLEITNLSSNPQEKCIRNILKDVQLNTPDREIVVRKLQMHYSTIKPYDAQSTHSVKQTPPLSSLASPTVSNEYIVENNSSVTKSGTTPITPQDVSNVHESELFIKNAIINVPMETEQNDKNLLRTSTISDAVNDFQETLDPKFGEPILSSTQFVQLNANNKQPELDVNDEILTKSMNVSTKIGGVSENVCDTEGDTTVYYNIEKVKDTAIVNTNENCPKIVTPLILRKSKKLSDFEKTVYQPMKKPRNVLPMHQNIDEDAPNLCYASPQNSFVQQQSISSMPEVPAIENTPRITRLAAARKARNNYARFPLSPRVLLHRIENVRQYQMLKKHLNSRAETKTNKRKSRIVQIIPTERNTPTERSKTKKLMINRERVLNIINTGSIDDLKKLHTIGVKTADLIYTYRDIHGNFTSLESMKKLWSTKSYQKFLNKNFLV
ncbi:kinesin-1 heavy chain-like [Contarinia nasturtii]|uniref:kinesin-1 heavy chain-like n=1 Tax=Contarinia nasturtii TaxID=265458 RepID=UPI0012D38C08|nr:kinesin-1 heavy chain-like [Contarinia nasturtii]